MTPFPETEIMTIKRLEVALRKMDFKLLKDGAYKLHEKYHSGHRFEYLDLLKELFADVSNNLSIPADIREILAPTIEDILSEQGVKTDTATSPYESLNQNRVSGLTSLSYGINVEKEEAKEENKSQLQEPLDKIYTQSPFSAEPFKEFYSSQTVSVTPQNNQDEPDKEVQQPLFTASLNTDTAESEETTEEENTTEDTAPLFSRVEEENETPALMQDTSFKIEQPQMPTAENIQEVKEETKTIAIFYSQENSSEKIKNISKLRALYSDFRSSNVGEIADLIRDINAQSNVNVSELKVILDQLKTKNHGVNLITNSQSSNFIELFDSNEIKYGIFDPKEENDLNFLPLFGLTNLFKCQDCKEQYIHDNKNPFPIMLHCPKCKGIMVNNLYASKNSECSINMDYYNYSCIALSNSKVWVLVHPSLDDKFSFNMLRSALKVSNQTEEIYILDKDINVRETYKKAFLDINKNISVNTQMNALEDFLNMVKQ